MLVGEERRAERAALGSGRAEREGENRARGVGEREGEGRRGKRRKKKKMGKRKEKGGVRNKGRERASALALIAVTVGHVRRAGRGPNRDGTAEDLGAGSVPRGIGKSGGRGNKKGIELNDKTRISA